VSFRLRFSSDVVVELFEVFRKLDELFYRREKFEFAKPDTNVPTVAEAQVVDAVVATSIFNVNSLVAHLASSEVGVIDVPKILGIATVQIFDFFI